METEKKQQPTEADKRRAAERIVLEDRKALEWALNQWRTDKALWVPEEALSGLFAGGRVSEDLGTEFTRIVVLNQVYGTGLYGKDLVEMAEYLSGSAARLNEAIHHPGEAANWGAVNCITQGIKGSREKFCYSFASKYCAFLSPERYYPYDSYVAALYRSRTVKERLKGTVDEAAFRLLGPWDGGPEDPERYGCFCRVAEGLRTYLSRVMERALTKKELDQALWYRMKGESEVCAAERGAAKACN